jgi:hypothetical protein
MVKSVKLFSLIFLFTIVENPITVLAKRMWIHAQFNRCFRFRLTEVDSIRM